jgi:hypothetical protein
LHLASDSEIGIRTRKRIPATKISPTQIWIKKSGD